MNYTLLIQNTITNQTQSYSLEDIGNDYYYKFEIELEEPVEGEYQYILKQEDDIVATGLLSIKDDSTNTKIVYERKD